MDGVQCVTCIFWAPPLPPGSGRCRRFPPAATHVDGLSEWPSTRYDDWCGEHASTFESDEAL